VLGNNYLQNRAMETIEISKIKNLKAEVMVK